MALSRGFQNVHRWRAEGTCRREAGGPRAAQALTHILIEGIGGKERHLHCCEPRCPQALPLDTTGVRMRRREEDAPDKNSDRQGLYKGPRHLLVSPTPRPHPSNRGRGSCCDGGGGGGGNTERAEKDPRVPPAGNLGDFGAA